MSNMKIKIVAVEQQTAKSKAGKDYNLVEVTYKNISFDGKVESKKHNQYGDKSVFEALKSASAGDEFTILRQKDDNGYWQWVGISKGFDSAPVSNSVGSAAPKPSAAPQTAAPKSNFETPEERAKRQVYIVRQSSIGHAIELLKTDKKTPDVQDVLATAKIFEQYVFGVNLDADPVEKLPKFDEDEDIPL